jgi:SAM-dependent methyltransferase
MQFKDHFSGHASDYAKYRPTYPDELFGFLASVAPDTNLAWDCATGNGQAALALTKYFDHIIATDASARQLENALQHEKIEYQVAPAEKTDIESQSCDLVMVAQSLHWFDFDRFFSEGKRVLKSGGVLAIWGYNLLKTDPAIDQLLDQFYFKTVGAYWPPERKWLETEYKDIPFPCRELSCPPFAMALEWTLYDLCGYLNTWSAVKEFIKKNQTNPVVVLGEQLQPFWGDPDRPRLIKWPLFLKAGKFTDEH